jgi:hypothetical protein
MPLHGGITSSLPLSPGFPFQGSLKTGFMTMAGTQIRIDIWDEGPTSIEKGSLGKSYTLKLGQRLNEADKGRVLQALGNFGRTLESWLKEKGGITNKEGN